jgi:hypothetical protein
MKQSCRFCGERADSSRWTSADAGTVQQRSVAPTSIRAVHPFAMHFNFVFGEYSLHDNMPGHSLQQMHSG